jgi:hypothetical protein
VIKPPSSARALARNSRLCGQHSPGRKTLHARLVLHAVPDVLAHACGLLDAVLLGDLLPVPVAAELVGLATIVT